MNRSALERRASTIGARRTVKKDWQAAWLLKAITLMDLTTLNSDDTPGRVERLCAKARHPVRNDILEGLGVTELDIKPAAVCVYHTFVATAVKALEGTGIPVAAVSHRASRTASRRSRASSWRSKPRSKDGAKEIDIVIERGMVLRGDWQALYDEVSAMRKACGDAHIKTILGTGELATLNNVAKASRRLHAGGRRFHQDLDRQGKGQRQPPDLARDGPHDPLVPRRDRHRDRLQARRRHRHRQSSRSTTWR